MGIDRRGTASAVALALLLLSCGPSTLGPAQLDAYLKDPANGCSVEHRSGNYRVQLTYRPTELVAWPDLQRAAAAGRSVDSVLATYGGLVHFMLTATLDSTDVVNALVARQGTGPDYGGLICQGLQDHARLEACGGELSPVLADYPRFYEMAKNTRILLAFPPPVDSTCGRWDVWVRNSFPGLAPFRCSFQHDAINDVPALDYISDHHP